MSYRLDSPLAEVPQMSPAEVDRAALSIQPYPGGFSGRGITICAGGFTYFTNAWILIRLLRKLKCELPIQFWHYGSEELDGRMAGLVRPYDVECVDARQVALKAGRQISRGWPLKPLSILHAPF